MNTRHVVLDDPRYCDGCPFFRVNSCDEHISYCRAMNDGIGREMYQEWLENSYYRTRRNNCPLPVAIMPPEGSCLPYGFVVLPPDGPSVGTPDILAIANQKRLGENEQLRKALLNFLKWSAWVSDGRHLESVDELANEYRRITGADFEVYT